MLFILIIIFSLRNLQHVACDPDTSGPIVDTTLGAVRGVRATDGDYTMYLGIPYAQVNRSNPFGIATPSERFESLFEANDDSRGCPEVCDSTVGSLDCLNLNVHVPESVQTKRPLPVLVWIYGGVFIKGSAQQWRPKYLMKHDIILVTFNFRSGPYGFMCLGTADVPGNQGLKDQVLALRWIKDNIRAFGGDDNNMTLLGSSSGSVMAHYHILFNKDRIIKNYILLSGIAIAYWTVKNTDETMPLVLAGKLGFTTNNITEALTFLDEQQEKSVIRAALDTNLEYGPCVEQSFDGVEAFVTEHPVNVIMNHQNLSILIGYAEDESIGRIDFELKIVRSKSSLDDFLQTAVNYYFDIDDSELMRTETCIAHNFYSGDETDAQKIIRSAVNVLGDIHVYSPTERATRSFVAIGATVYRYEFTYIGERNLMRHHNHITDGGAAHVDELSYIFHLPEDFPDDPTPADQHMIDVMTTLFYNFARCSAPSPSPTELLPVKWLPVTNDTLHYLRIDSTLSMATRPFNRRMAFWDLMFMANENNIKGSKGNVK